MIRTLNVLSLPHSHLILSRSLAYSYSMLHWNWQQLSASQYCNVINHIPLIFLTRLIWARVIRILHKLKGHCGDFALDFHTIRGREKFKIKAAEAEASCNNSVKPQWHILGNFIRLWKPLQKAIPRCLGALQYMTRKLSLMCKIGGILLNQQLRFLQLFYFCYVSL